MSNDSKSNATSNTRWWEAYLVRYFSGAIVGAICLLIIFLFANYRIGYADSIKNLLITKYFPISFFVIALIAGGLVYSYIISSPITVIHFARSGSHHYLEKQVRYFWLGWVAALIKFQFLIVIGIGKSNSEFGIFAFWMVIFLFSGCYLIFLYFLSKNSVQKIQSNQNNLFKSISWAGFLLSIAIVVSHIFNFQNRSILIFLFLFSIPTIFVGLMQYFTLFRVLKTEEKIHDFYSNLSRARSLENSKDIRETYTHLREHSNATFIVLLELCFTAFVIFLIEIYLPPIPSTVPKDIPIKDIGVLANAGLLIVAVWIVPNLFMWSRANALEKDFAGHPERYTSPNESQLNQTIRTNRAELSESSSVGGIND